MIRIDLYKKMDDVSSTYGILELSITLNWSLTRAGHVYLQAQLHRLHNEKSHNIFLYIQEHQLL